MPSHFYKRFVSSERADHAIRRTYNMRALIARPRATRQDERGEGVISLAIGVLIMAFLSAGMWVAFNSTMTKAQTQVDNQVVNIGGGTP